jgi:uncharacterized membrane protein
MSLVAVGLVLLSALLHAVWNLFNKDTADKWGFYVAQGVCAILLYGGPAVWFALRHPPDPTGLWLSALSIAVHCGYAIYILKSYEVGDLSLAYPLSRTAPVLVTAWEAVVSPTELTTVGVAGALLASIGGVALQLPALRLFGARAVLRAPVTRYALSAAAFIAAFTVVDKVGVARVHPFLFLYLIMAGEFVVLTGRLGRAAAARARREFHANRRPIVFTAVAGPVSYLLILWALVIEPASYVLSLRQTSIVFGVLLGRLVLREGEWRTRLAGAAIVVVGGLLVALGG